MILLCVNCIKIFYINFVVYYGRSNYPLSLTNTTTGNKTNSQVNRTKENTDCGVTAIPSVSCYIYILHNGKL